MHPLCQICWSVGEATSLSQSKVTRPQPMATSRAMGISPQTQGSVMNCQTSTRWRELLVWDLPVWRGRRLMSNK